MFDYHAAARHNDPWLQSRRVALLNGQYRTEEEAWLFQHLSRGAHPEAIESSVIRLMNTSGFPNDIRRCRAILTHIQRLRMSGAFNGMATLRQLQQSQQMRMGWDGWIGERFHQRDLEGMVRRMVSEEIGEFFSELILWFPRYDSFLVVLSLHTRRLLILCSYANRRSV